MSHLTSTKSGRLYIISAPSGAGKTSLVKALIESTSGIELSVSYTTRAKRPGEQEGVHYYFVDDEQFQSLVNEGVFLEHARVFDHYYGTSQRKINDRLQSGTDVILEIDWQGAQQVRKLIPQTTGIFILPPSKSALEERLQSRGQDSDEVIARRMQDAVNEISHYAEFDYLVINDNFDTALQELKSIITAHRLDLQRQTQQQAELLAELLA